MRILRLAVAYTLLLFVAGCAATLPLHVSPNESYLTHPDGYTVLGQVEGASSVTSILFFGFSGDAGYRAAIQDALAKSQADGLINCVSDATYTNMFFYRSIKTTVRGLAIKKK